MRARTLISSKSLISLSKRQKTAIFGTESLTNAQSGDFIGRSFAKGAPTCAPLAGLRRDTLPIVESALVNNRQLIYQLGSDACVKVLNAMEFLKIRDRDTQEVAFQVLDARLGSGVGYTYLQGEDIIQILRHLNNVKPVSAPMLSIAESLGKYFARTQGMLSLDERRTIAALLGMLKIQVEVSIIGNMSKRDIDFAIRDGLGLDQEGGVDFGFLNGSNTYKMTIHAWKTHFFLHGFKDGNPQRILELKDLISKRSGKGFLCLYLDQLEQSNLEYSEEKSDRNSNRKSLTSFFEQLEAMTHQDGSKPAAKFDEDGDLIESFPSTIGLQTFRSLGKGEWLDSEQTFKEYLKWVRKEYIMEEGQQLAYTNKLDLKTVDVAASLLLWGRGKQKMDVLLVRPDLQKLVAAAASDTHLQLSDFTELTNLARLTWLIDCADWLSVHDTNKCLFCDKYAEVREMPQVMNMLRSSLIGRKFAFEEDMIAQRILTMAKVTHKSDEYANVDIALPHKLVPGVLKSLQTFWKHYDSQSSQMSSEQYIANYRTYSAAGTSQAPEKSGLFAGLLLANSSGRSASVQRLEAGLNREEKDISGKVRELMSLEQTLRARGTKPKLKGVSCLAVQGVCRPTV